MILGLTVPPSCLHHSHPWLLLGSYGLKVEKCELFEVLVPFLILPLLLGLVRDLALRAEMTFPIGTTAHLARERALTKFWRHTLVTQCPPGSDL